MTQKLININKNQPRTTLIEQVIEWFTLNGNLPFEHGFKSNKVTVNGFKYQITECDRDSVHFSYKTPEGTMKQARTGWFTLSSKTIIKIIDECNRYYDYVMTQG